MRPVLGVILELLLVGLLSQRVLAANILTSTGFSNCQDNASVKVNSAHIQFDQATGIVTFDVSGTSTEVQKVKAALVVTAYGQQVYEKDFDPCDPATAVAQLCPVPQGSFSANGTQTIPSQYLSQIPSIAFSIPDLDGDATLKLTSADTGAEVGCIESGVSNGKSLQLGTISYVAAGIAGAALLLTSLSGLSSSGVGGHPQTVGFTTIFTWFQTISTTGMMSANPPPIYRSFSKNFAFSTGLVSWPQMQASIDSFRSSTGGNLTEDNVQFLQNATLAFSNGESNTTSLARRGLELLPARGLNFGAGNSSAGNDAGGPRVQHVVYGIGGYVEELMIPQSNTFMTALLIFAVVVAAIAVGILLFKVILESWALFGSFPKRLTSFRKRYWRLLANTITSLIFLLYGIWTTWCIFQFTNGDSWAAKILAAVTLAIFTAVLAFFCVKIVLIARKYSRADGDASALYENKETWIKYSFFYDTYKKSHWWLFMPAIVIMFARGCVLAAGNGHGLQQTAAQLFVEGFTLIFLLWTRPYATPAGNWINIFIQLVRVSSFVCVLIFVEQLGIAQTTKTVTGVVLIAVQAILTALLAILIAVNAIIVCCRENPHRRRRKEQEKMAREFDTLTPLDAHNSLLLGADARNGPSSLSTVDGAASYPVPPVRHMRGSSYAPVPNPAFGDGGYRRDSTNSQDNLIYQGGGALGHNRNRSSGQASYDLDMRHPTLPDMGGALGRRHSDQRAL